jgi:hypothetical protein
MIDGCQPRMMLTIRTYFSLKRLQSVMVADVFFV